MMDEFMKLKAGAALQVSYLWRTLFFLYLPVAFPIRDFNLRYFLGAAWTLA